MNSIEIAKKLIEENNEVLAGNREWIDRYEKRKKDLEKSIADYKEAIETLERSLFAVNEQIIEIRNENKQYLVDNLALKTFIAEGGGLDMLD